MNYKNNSRFSIIKFLSILMVCFFTGAILIALFRIPIKEISCKNGNGVCSDQVLEITNQSAGKGLVPAMRSLSKNLFLSDRVIQHKITFTFPSHLHVDIIERQPAVALKAYGSPEATLYELSGRVIGNGVVGDLPYVEFQQQLLYGPESLSFIVELMYALNRSFGLKNAIVSDNGLRVTVPNGGILVYPFDGNIDRLLGATRLVLGELNRVSENSTMKTIDFRYSNPILK